MREHPRPPVLTKADFVTRFLKGEFGNTGPQWDTLEEFKAANYQGLVHIRNRVAGGQTWYNVPANEVEWWWHTLSLEGHAGQLYLAGMAPHHCGTLQGEVQQSYDGRPGLVLYYSTLRLPMRPALAQGGKQVWGVQATELLKHHLCPNSWEWLNVLLERYEGHVVEFSTFDCNWGTLPQFNTAIWEVRKY